MVNHLIEISRKSYKKTNNLTVVQVGKSGDQRVVRIHHVGTIDHSDTAVTSPEITLILNTQPWYCCVPDCE